jgi:hypothetical protein
MSYFRRESEQLFHRQLRKISKANKEKARKVADTRNFGPQSLFQQAVTSSDADFKYAALSDQLESMSVGSSPGPVTSPNDVDLALVDSAIIFAQ